MGIAALPGAEFAQSVVDFQGRYRHVIEGPRLGLVTNLPHVSLLQCPLDSSIDGEEVLTSVVSDDHDAGRGSLLPVRVSYYPVGWLFLDVAKTDWLDALHNRALAAAAASIDASKIDRSKSLTGYTPLQRANYLRYGYRYVGAAFHPHLTLGRVAEGLPSETFIELTELFGLEVGYAEQRVERLVFYRAGEYGALAEVLAELILE